jgi:hypothetical protein
MTAPDGMPDIEEQIRQVGAHIALIEHLGKIRHDLIDEGWSEGGAEQAALVMLNAGLVHELGKTE